MKKSLARVLDYLPWRPGDSAVKSDPHKTVKWIDVSGRGI